MKYRHYVIVNIILPMVVGFAIYAFFRDSNLLIYAWADFLGFFSHALSIKLDLTQWLQIPECIKFSLPDGIWIYVFTSAMFAIWTRGINLLWLSLPLLLGLGMEVLQVYQIVPGTFDSIDILFLITGYILAIVSGYKWRIKCIEQ